MSERTEQHPKLAAKIGAESVTCVVFNDGLLCRETWAVEYDRSQFGRGEGQKHYFATIPAHIDGLEEQIKELESKLQAIKKAVRG